MTDLLQQAAEWLGRQRVKHLARLVEYRRGDDRLEIRAAIGRTLFEVDDGLGVLERVESRDFLLLAAELVFDGRPAIPRQGDQIREMHGANTLVYEVAAPGREPAWRYADPYRTTLRVHTKQIENN